MDSTAKSQRKILAAKANTPVLESRASPRKNGKSAEKMPELIAGALSLPLPLFSSAVLYPSDRQAQRM